MVGTCSVAGCKDCAPSKYSFPNPIKENERFEVWRQFCQNPKLYYQPLECMRSYRVCGKHFRPSEVNLSGRLMYKAVPTLHRPTGPPSLLLPPTIVPPPTPPGAISEHAYAVNRSHLDKSLPDSPASPPKTKAGTCSVAGCKTMGFSKIKFPSYAKEKERFLEWVQFCGNWKLAVEKPDVVETVHRMCDIHFLPSDFNENGMLKDSAVPCLHKPFEPTEPPPEHTYAVNMPLLWQQLTNSTDSSKDTTRTKTRAGSCVVAGCKDSASFKHKFPSRRLQKERFCEWIKFCGNPNLTNEYPHVIEGCYRICNKHFLPSDFTKNGHLKDSAMPSVFTPTVALVPPNSSGAMPLWRQHKIYAPIIRTNNTPFSRNMLPDRTFIINKLEKWCRLCCQERDELLNIIDDSQLAERIEEYFAIKINSDDLLPKGVCFYCYDSIATFCDFMHNVKEVQKYFTSLNKRIFNNVVFYSDLKPNEQFSHIHKIPNIEIDLTREIHFLHNQKLKPKNYHRTENVNAEVAPSPIGSTINLLAPSPSVIDDTLSEIVNTEVIPTPGESSIDLMAPSRSQIDDTLIKLFDQKTNGDSKHGIEVLSIADTWEEQAPILITAEVEEAKLPQSNDAILPNSPEKSNVDTDDVIAMDIAPSATITISDDEDVEVSKPEPSSQKTAEVQIKSNPCVISKCIKKKIAVKIGKDGKILLTNINLSNTPKHLKISKKQSATSKMIQKNHPKAKIVLIAKSPSVASEQTAKGDAEVVDSNKSVITPATDLNTSSEVRTDENTKPPDISDSSPLTKTDIEVINSHEKKEPDPSMPGL